MVKTKEELIQIKKEFTELTAKLQELTEKELNEVTGGDGIEWLYEKTYVVLNNACHSESIYDVIGGWPIEEHSN